MITELFLYDKEKGLFKNVLQHSTVIAGRYHVSPSYGSDLNTNNLETFLKDAKYGLSDEKQKYPICVCMPPYSHLGLNENEMEGEEFFFDLFFLCTSGYTGNNQVKSVDKPTQKSSHHLWYDWKDMKEVASNFIKQLRAVWKTKGLKQYLDIDFSRIPVRRLSNFNNDKVSGVQITLRAEILNTVCEIIDYAEDATANIVVPDTNIHPLHKH